MARPKSKIWTMTRDEFQQVISKHTCTVGVLTELGFKRTSGSMAKMIKDRIAQGDIDVSHMTHTASTGGKPIHNLKDILIKNSPYTNRERLKIRLVREGFLEYKCACGNTGEWNGKKLTLQLDHIDGAPYNHELDNLRFLCPNCHSQTETFSGRNRSNT
jgi:hypothetical protein